MDRLGLLVVGAAVLIAGCSVPRSAVRVHVQTAGGTAVDGAVVAWVCRPTGDAGAVTGGDGVAELTIFNSEPERCVVTVAKPGFHTQQLTVEQLAEPVEVELEEEAAP